MFVILPPAIILLPEFEIVPLNIPEFNVNPPVPAILFAIFALNVMVPPLILNNPDPVDAVVVIEEVPVEAIVPY